MIEILLVIVLALFSGFFALSEMAVMTSRKQRLKQLALTSTSARKAMDLAEHPENFLSAVQVWIQMLALLMGSFGGESLATRLKPPLIELGIPLITKYADKLSFAFSFTAILLISVVIGELVPKRLATLRPEKIASAVAIPMNILSMIARPAVFILTLLTRTLLRIMGLGKIAEEKVTEEEIRHLVAESHEQGVIDQDERNMLNRVLRLGDRTSDSLMTPRTRITWLDANGSLEDNLAKMRDTLFARFPVYRGSDADVLGILEVKTLAGQMDIKSTDELLRQLRPALFVSDSTSALRLLEIFREEQQTVGLVVDEYGDIQGLVSLNDLLGAVLGRIQDGETSEDEPSIIQRADNSWLIDGRVSADELKELLSLHALPNEDNQGFTTAAGMVIAHYGRIPHVGEYFDWQRWRIEVVDLDGARIDKLLIAAVPEKPSDPEAV
ncbi:MAG: hemolysin family protein [Arenimonas sp.]